MAGKRRSWKCHPVFGVPELIASIQYGVSETRLKSMINVKARTKKKPSDSWIDNYSAIPHRDNLAATNENAHAYFKWLTMIA